MPFELREVSSSDFPTLIRAMWDTYESPLQPFFYVWAPLNPSTSTSPNPSPDRESAIQESTARFWAWHTSDSTSYWHAVVDTDNGDKVVAGGLWRIHERNPYEKDAVHAETSWHPEGGQRELATKLFWGHEAVRERLARRAHLYLNIIFTLPEYQGKGVGKMILNWGIQKAEEMDVEMWLDAWRFGRPVYEKMGFTVVDHHTLKPETESPDEEWTRCEKDWGSNGGFEEWIMWRPKRGPFVEGETETSWGEAIDRKHHVLTVREV